MDPTTLGDSVPGYARVRRFESAPLGRHVQAQAAVRLEAQTPLDPGAVGGRVRNADPIAKGARIEHRGEGHRGTDPKAPVRRHHGRVHARDARTVEHRARRDRMALPPPEVMLKRRVRIEAEPVEQVEQGEGGGLRELVAEGHGGDPRPQGALVPDGLDRQIVRGRDGFRERVEVHRGPGQVAGVDKPCVFEVLAELRRLGRRTRPPDHRQLARPEVFEGVPDRRIDSVHGKLGAEDPVHEFMTKARADPHHARIVVDPGAGDPAEGRVQSEQVPFNRLGQRTVRRIFERPQHVRHPDLARGVRMTRSSRSSALNADSSLAGIPSRPPPIPLDLDGPGRYEASTWSIFFRSSPNSRTRGSRRSTSISAIHASISDSITKARLAGASEFNSPIPPWRPIAQVIYNFAYTI